ncbi:MAG: hypothetical protein ACR652_04415 [Methylocystis sp.]|uniref:hypothetical protein n=1 Tax=Methylocystis sp. TaxID=1911079 RepID=UPI003DA457D9
MIYLLELSLLLGLLFPLFVFSGELRFAYSQAGLLVAARVWFFYAFFSFVVCVFLSYGIVEMNKQPAMTSGYQD